MKRKVICIGALTILVSALSGCGPQNNQGLIYPDFPTTPGDKDSWEYLKNEDGTVAFKFLNEDIWDKYVTAKVLDEEKTSRDRISKGLELFGRYFENLWD